MKIITPVAVPYARCTHTRDSDATYIDNTGFLRDAAPDELRYTYHPDTLDFEGVLIEPARTNYVPNSSNRNNQTFNVSVSASSGVAIVSFYGGGTLTLTGPGLPATGLTISGTVGQFERAFAAFPHQNGTYTFSFSGIGRYVQYEIAPYPTTASTAPFDGIFVDGAPPTSTELLTPDYLAAMQRPTSWIRTAGSPAIRAADVLDGYGIIDSTFTETAQPYDPETPYALGAEVLVGIDVYESAIADNMGNDPTKPPEWFRVRTSNEYAFLDLYRGGRSTVDSPGRVAVRLPDHCDSVTLVDFSATLVAVATSRTVTDIYDNDFAVYRSSFQDFGADLPTALYLGELTDNAVTARHVQFSADVISVEMRAPESVELGEVVVGNAFEPGHAQFGFGVGIIDFSKKGTDDWGNYDFRPGKFRKPLDVNVWVEKKNYNATLKKLYAVRATPTVFVATDLIDYAEGAVIFGFFRDFNLVVPYPNDCVLNMQVESLA
jgi:hypothetical protein